MFCLAILILFLLLVIIGNLEIFLNPYTKYKIDVKPKKGFYDSFIMFWLKGFLYIAILLSELRKD